MDKGTLTLNIYEQSGWWTVICQSLDISGQGDSYHAALLAAVRSMHSTVHAASPSDFNPAELRAESEARKGKPSLEGAAARRSLSEPVELRSIIEGKLAEARRRKRVEKHGHMFNSQDYYAGQIAVLTDLLNILALADSEALKGNDQAHPTAAGGTGGAQKGL